jgi:zinc/manganese transport system substrate-binding protein
MRLETSRLARGIGFALAAVTALVLLGGLALPDGAAARELRVVAATTDLGAIARAVAGEEARVEVVARPDRDLHSLEVRPSTLRLASRADVYLEVGMSLDLWSDDVVRGSRNREIRVVDCSRAIEPLEVPTGRVDASQGDVHPEGNPHYWLDPLNVAAVGRLVATELSVVDPEGAEGYAARAEELAREIDRRLPAWADRLRGRVFLEHHATWVYLAERFDMTIAGRIEPLPGIPPTARHLSELAAVIRERKVPLVVRDTYHSDSAPEFLARETGVRTWVLPASCDEPTPESLFAHFDRIAEVLGER